MTRVVIRRTRVLVAGALTVLAVSAVGLAIRIASPPVLAPSFADVKARHRPSDLVLLDRHGEVIHERRIDPRWRRLAWTPLDEISPAVRAAVLAAEDRRFERHGGGDVHAVVAAAVARARGGPPRGASTVTMQLATLLDPALQRRGGPRTLAQKWKQMRLAWAIESRWAKDQILEAYLNRVALRGELEGVPAAASVLFGKAPHGLTEAEAVVLAALVRAPNASREAAVRRATALVTRLGFTITPEALESAVRGAIEAPAGGGPRMALAPHAATRLLPVTVAGSVTAVASTLDVSVQRLAAEALRRHLLAVRARHVQDGAVLVVDNATGEVLAYVGGDPELGSARFALAAEEREGRARPRAGQPHQDEVSARIEREVPGDPPGRAEQEPHGGYTASPVARAAAARRASNDASEPARAEVASAR
ncbi:MAG TPA: transglycosylase domain-containing protein [Candidatus Limnocylindrales bacterium]|nr:transglycosylase domain-containing protein [Candidatus Limnocylindrales bacterium]